MALIQAIVSLITQTVGRILSALLDWAVVSLFGRVTGNRKLFLWGMMAAAAAWPVLLLGIVAPRGHREEPSPWISDHRGALGRVPDHAGHGADPARRVVAARTPRHVRPAGDDR